MLLLCILRSGTFGASADLSSKIFCASDIKMQGIRMPKS